MKTRKRATSGERFPTLRSDDSAETVSDHARARKAAAHEARRATAAPAALNVSVHQETGMESGTVPLPREVTLGDEEDTAIERVTLSEPDRNPG